MSNLLIRDVHIALDDEHGSHAPTTSILVQDGRIAHVGAPSDAQARDIPVLDGRGAWALPGFTDVHCHLCYDFPRRFRDATDPIIGLVSTANAAAKLAAGVTLVRDLGAMAQRNIQLAAAITSGHIEGPAMLTSGDMISAVGGHMHHYSRQVASVPEMRHAVRDQIDNGAEWIKLMVSGGLATPDELWNEVQLPGSLIRAATETAHENGVRVAAHAHPKEAILSAVMNGCDTIEHATCIDEEVISALIQYDVAVVPTLAVYARMMRDEYGPTRAHQQAAEDLWKAKIPGLHEAHVSGVRIGVGTDSGGSFPPGDIATEIQLMVAEVGVPVVDALRMVSEGNAEILGLSDARGSITVGKVGDVVLIDADPSADLSGLSRVSAVVTGGVLAGRLAGNPISDSIDI